MRDLVIEQRHPSLCLCRGDRVVRVLLLDTGQEWITPCLHCIGRIPIAKESKTK